MANAAPAELPAGVRREAHGALPSTNAAALARAREGAAGPLWVTAEAQTAGRGRRGRTWDSPRGNLFASLLVVDPAPTAVAAAISFAAGVALHQAVVDLAGPPVVDRLTLKWPNDLLLDRRKIAGILVEGEKLADGRFAVVVGIGVNCVAHPEIEDAFPATDFAAAGVPVDAEALFQRLALRISEELLRWDRGVGFAEVRSAWLARAGGVGEAIRVNLPDRALEGRFEALDHEGRLILILADGLREAITAGDVYFGRSA